ncbi:MAG TPA: Asp-tRNA(Asn)/Glu-tRNA(Gln) amidotransferase GatCAB subunit A [Kosmotogaceae bacterium]|nr:MAG: Glutamyl-tRNA(Gln) amidotransferase subunit A [Thermotogales bacterium 46_20]HAA85958.1 Asp-tRNA(Asn)/Glu-tRNA(Gln) amidotransferase GatCAB subunit A [Kosmotogaceae bacterium]
MDKSVLKKSLEELTRSELPLESFYRERISRFNGEINAFTEVREANTDCHEGPLKGIPFAAKDNIHSRGFRTSCGSRMLKKYYSPYSATVIDRLGRAGACLIGKTNMDEFAMGSSTENSCYGASRNPWDTRRISGGSSGGSAAAVSAGLIPFALGSDTGGSIRQPAALCGIVGFKPSYGLVSRYGLTAFASSLDQIGPLSRSVKDALDVMRVIAGRDPKDATTVGAERELFDHNLEPDLSGKKLAVPKEVLEYEGLDGRVYGSFMDMIERIRQEGGIVDEVSVPSIKHVVAVYYLIAPAEASSNLARYEGTRYGFSELSSSYLRSVGITRDMGLGEEVKRRILLGTFTLSSAYYDAYYSKALKVRRILDSELSALFGDYDFLVNPTCPVIAPKVGEITDPLVFYLMDIYTIAANLSGLPSISIPAQPADNMPVGFQITGPRMKDMDVLSTGAAVEAISPFLKDGIAPIPERWDE